MIIEKKNNELFLITKIKNNINKIKIIDYLFILKRIFRKYNIDLGILFYKNIIEYLLTSYNLKYISNIFYIPLYNDTINLSKQIVNKELLSFPCDKYDNNILINNIFNHFNINDNLKKIFYKHYNIDILNNINQVNILYNFYGNINRIFSIKIEFNIYYYIRILEVKKIIFNYDIPLKYFNYLKSINSFKIFNEYITENHIIFFYDYFFFNIIDKYIYYKLFKNIICKINISD
jgi:hypothetical protein